MIFLETNIDDFLVQFPSLKNGSLRTCQKYNLDINQAKPFITKEKVGILLNPNEECPITIHVFRDEELNKEAVSFFTHVLQ